ESSRRFWTVWLICLRFVSCSLALSVITAATINSTAITPPATGPSIEPYCAIAPFVCLAMSLFPQRGVSPLPVLLRLRRADDLPVAVPGLRPQLDGKLQRQHGPHVALELFDLPLDSRSALF